MSTKIHNGYRLPLMSLAELTRRVVDFRARAKAEAGRLFQNKVADLAVGAIDAAACGWPDHELFAAEPGKFRYHLASQVEDFVLAKHKAAHATQRRDPEYDFGINVCLIPRPAAILATLYTEHPSLQAAWEATPGVRPWPYWDNTDRPKNVSAAAWRRRGEAWDAAMPHGPPADVGLTVEPIGQHDYLVGISGGVDAILVRWPASRFDERVTHWAKEIVLQRRVRRLLMRIKKVERAYRVGGLMFEHRNWAETPEGRRTIEAAATFVRNRIPTVITPGQLLAELPVPKPDQRVWWRKF